MKQRSHRELLPATGATLKLFLALAALQTTGEAFAQQGIKNVLAAEAAAGIHPLNLEAMPYTYKSGDFRLLLTPSLEADWNNNVNISKTNALEDYVLRPLLQIDSSYPITQVNLLKLNVGVGYDDYLRYHQYSNLRVNSGSQIAFDTYIKDVLINAHDRFNYYQDAAGQSVVAGTGDFGTEQNVAGVTVAWNPRDLNLSVGYDHQTLMSTGTPIKSQDKATELANGRAGWKFEPTASAGVEATYSSTAYDQAVLNNNESYTIGVYGEWQPGTYFKVAPRAGYVIYAFQNTSKSGEVITPSSSPSVIVTQTGQPIATSDLHSWYADVTLSHEITRALSYGLSVGHELQPGVQSDSVEDSYARLSSSWKVLKRLTVQSSFSFEHGKQGYGNITGNLGETYDWYTGSLMVQHDITSRLSVGVNSRLTYRCSTTSSLGYTQGLVGLQLAYAFK